jgi:glycerol uptake facilitator-like aquaporin
MVFPGRSIADVVPGRGEDVSLVQMLLMETILSTILMYVIFACAFDKIENKSEHSSGLTIYKTGGGSKAAFAPIAISFIVGGLIFVGGSVSGGCFNPARSFGPAFVTSTWKDHW